ncbi:MAG: transketolase [Geminicoccaceae bacterium]|nr:transketolase [Geminicoccaceae bacterium]MDW8370635.1 transketolase [Geminicoccaceae bacterium]
MATRTVQAGVRDPETLAVLRAIEKKLLWLSAWTIHHANHLRPSRDKLKVGGHQASCASVATILTALFFDALRPHDRIAVKPHASPIYHAAMYLLGRQSRERLERFRALGGAQAYPSRTKDTTGVDFSTGSVGLGAAMTLFASLAQDHVRLRGLVPPDRPEGRMVAIVGDAELDEGNVFEALLEGWKYDVRNLWWIIDYNRQSLDRVVPEKLFAKIEQFFATVGWDVVTIKYGKKLQAAFAEPGGNALKEWIDACPNDLYAALTFKGGAAWRAHLESDLGRNPTIRRILDRHDDAGLAALMTNLGGHDVEAVLEAFDAAAADDRPRCFIAYTVKGYGLPMAGHKDSHAALMTAEQIEALRAAHGIPAGCEWEPLAGLDVDADRFRRFLDAVPYARRVERYAAPPVAVPVELPTGRRSGLASTQETFGRIMGELARSDLPLAERIVTTSPDVTVSTGLAPWVSRRNLFNRKEHEDVFRAEQVTSPTLWRESRTGQHIELGIAENNLFLNLAALGLAHELFGARLLPVGTLYDPFIARGLDALTYACYQGARFLLVATPSGISLAPEGGAHQSIGTPLVGMSQPGLTYMEPAFADELAVMLRWAFAHLQEPEGGAVYLRLTTRAIAQPDRRMDAELERAVLAGGYWLARPAEGAELAIVFTGAVAPEAQAALEAVREDVPGAGLLNVTSADRLFADWRARGGASAAARLLAPLAPEAVLVTVLDGHPATLSWLGSVRGDRVEALGVDRFGQSADIPDLYRLAGIDTEAILEACARGLLARARRRGRAG